ncbi:family 43 glycosylhydrolase [Pedobacter sp. JCM 36344]|uniref:glycoside hydrolase family 43 protein n=1 Tax=Pedobacter sp. JCM 36344 TaxID=3374280 RepID=UPI00397D9A34
MKRLYSIFLLVLPFIWLASGENSLKPFFKEPRQFSNPILPSGADPWSIYKDGFYYYTNTTGSRLEIWKTKNLVDLKTAERKVIWRPPSGTNYSKEIWAPELHFLNGKWYMYFAADNGDNQNHRMYVVENVSADPMKGEWVFKGKVGDKSDKWAIDGTVFEHKKQLYMLWSGWEGDKNGQQNIYIAKMSNPYTISSERRLLSEPELDWEKVGSFKDPYVSVNEGPQILINKSKIFLIYSASGCWTDSYNLGMLTFNGKNDLLDPKAWVKNKTSVFSKSEQNGVYAPGHNSFFKSTDGKEDWILYHANDNPGQGCGNLRSPRAQRFTWNKDGSPNFGLPLGLKQQLKAPD